MFISLASSLKSNVSIVPLWNVSVALLSAPTTIKSLSLFLRVFISLIYLNSLTVRMSFSLSSSINSSYRLASLIKSISSSVMVEYMIRSYAPCFTANLLLSNAGTLLVFVFLGDALFFVATAFLFVATLFLLPNFSSFHFSLEIQERNVPCEILSFSDISLGFTPWINNFLAFIFSFATPPPLFIYIVFYIFQHKKRKNVFKFSL